LSITNGLQVWLEADAGVTTNGVGQVMNWADQSGNGNDGTPDHHYGYSTAAGPFYVANGLNSLPVLRFNGQAWVAIFLLTNQSLNLSGGLSIFIVARNDDRRNFNGVFRLGDTSGDPFNVNSAMEIYWNAGASGSGGLDYTVNRDGAGTFGGLLSNGSEGPTAGNGFGYLYDVIAAASSATQRMDQADVSSTPFSSTQLPVNAGYASIGVGYGGSATYALDGDIAEVLIYNTTLSRADRNSVESYLFNKWFVPAEVPEPSTLALLGLGGFLVWKRRRNVR
jgi:hypothetical protein